MKKIIYTLAMLVAGSAAYAQPTARVQAIHNCPDPGAATVDIWVTVPPLAPSLEFPGVSYQDATPFFDAPGANTPFIVSITAPGAPDTVNAVFHKQFALPTNSTNVVVATGELAGGANAFDLVAFAGQEEATNIGASEVSVKVFHGVYDAPMVDVWEVQATDSEIVPDLSYGEDAGYLDLPAIDFDLQVRLQDGQIVNQEFDADLSAAGDAAAVVLATGYADPGSAVGTEPFGLLAVFPDGTTALLPGKTTTPARLQVIHNCPDPGAASVDVWLNAGPLPLLDNFGYQEATAYIDAPAGEFFDVTIAGPTSTDTTNEVFRKTFLLQSNRTYVVVANGGLAETGATAFDLVAFAGQEQATNQGATEVSVKAFHGSYDAPEVDVYEVQVGAGNIVPDLEFNEDAGYLDLPAADFDLQVRLNDGTVVGQFDANTTTLADGAGVIVATGYADPASAVGTEPFGLLLVLPDGTVLNLPAQSVDPARLQVIHNCAAVDAAEVDVWLNDTKLIPNFEFRTAAGFIDAPAGAMFDVTITAPNAMDTTMELYRESFMLASDSTYIIVAGGTIGSGTYTPAEPFQLDVITGAREASMTAGNVDVLVYHGATDAPTVDVNELTVPVTPLVPAISYGEAQGYLDLAEMDYILEVAAGGSAVATFGAPLMTLGLADSAITVLASGFLDPSVNNNGEAFGLWVALPNGGDLVPLPNLTGIEEEAVDFNVYPVPANDQLIINLDNATNGTIELYDVMGARVMETPVVGSMTVLNTSALANGQYVVRIVQNNQVASRTIQVLH